ncbi:hypothetical protein [Dankookia sp. P2]|uniref:hypothetical protein n=1 Tax=Dankookia sp. P2 TaxID=3423955 RepID=UPI003D6693F3
MHATVQLVDYSETNLSGQLGRIHEQIAGLVAIPAASTRNSGVELEAVVQATEAAANTIMEAAEAIQDWIKGGAQDKAALQALSARVNLDLRGLQLPGRHGPADPPRHPAPAAGGDDAAGHDAGWRDRPAGRGSAGAGAADHAGGAGPGWAGPGAGRDRQAAKRLKRVAPEGADGGAREG